MASPDDDSQQPVWVQGADGPIPTTPAMAAKLGLKQIDMAQYQPPVQPQPPDPDPSSAQPSAASAQLINYGIGQNDAPALPNPLPGNAGNFPVQAQPQTAPPQTAPPSSAAPPAPSQPPQVAAPQPFKFPTGGGGGGGGNTNSQMQDLQGSQKSADDSAMEAAEDSGDANTAAAKQVRDQVEQGISTNATEDAANQAARQAFVQTRDARLAKQQQLMDDDRNDKIDPNHFWASRDAGQKTMATIGMLLSGLGSGLQGGGAKNAAEEVINQAINQDFDAQKQNIANKRENTRQQGDFVQQANAAGLSDQEAKEMHRIRAYDTVQKNVEMLSKSATGPQAQAAAQEMQARLQQEQAMHKQNLVKLSSDLGTQAASRAHMQMENQQLGRQMALEKYQVEHPELFRPQEQIARIAGQQVDVGRGNNGPEVTSLTEQHQHAIGLVDKAIQKSGSSYGIPFTGSSEQGEAEAAELRGTLAPLVASNPRLGAKLVDKLVGDNARSTWHGQPEKLRQVRQYLLDNYRDQVQSKTNMTPAQAQALTNHLWPSSGGEQ